MIARPTHSSRVNVRVRPMTGEEQRTVRVCETTGCLEPAEVWADYDLEIRTPGGVRQSPALGRGVCRACAALMEVRERTRRERRP